MSAKVFIKPRKARPFWFGDPWVFDGSVDRIKGRRDLAHGDVVEVCDNEGKLIGRGLYSAESRIVVRMVTLGEAAFDETEVRRRVAQAVALRERTLHLGQAALQLSMTILRFQVL